MVKDMNIINNIKLNFYQELKTLDISDDLKIEIISNPEFKSQYKTSIKPFIQYLKKSKITDKDTLSQHIKCVFELSVSNNSDKYIKYIKSHDYWKINKIENFQVFSDSNFQTLYSIISDKIFNNNIAEIIQNGNSNKLIDFLKNYPNIKLDKINPLLFEDKVWNVIINKNNKIDNTEIFDYFYSNNILDLFITFVNNNYIEGLIYTYKNFPESHEYIKSLCHHNNDDASNFIQFSMDFIKNIGDNDLNKLYQSKIFYYPNQYKKMFEIASLKNYELIQDIINYGNIIHFQFIDSKDMKKSSLEIDGVLDKKKLIFGKFFGITGMEVDYIKLFLESINKLNNLPNEFQEKYGDILQLLNKVFTANNEVLLSISEKLDSKNREAYRTLITNMEISGNNILKEKFANDIKIRNQQIINTSTHKQILTNNEKTVDIYELTGQPFTMLVHAITHVTSNDNNYIADKLLEDPTQWANLTGGNNYISTSLISDNYMATFATPDNDKTLMFGFSDIPSENIKNTAPNDSGTNTNVSTNANFNMRTAVIPPTVNTITTVDHLMEKTIERNAKVIIKGYNEVILDRTNKDTKIMPNYIVCMDQINEKSIEAAAYYGIPIYLIHRYCYNRNVSIKNDQNNTTNEEEENIDSLKKR